MSWSTIAKVNIGQIFNIKFNEGSVVLVRLLSTGYYLWRSVQFIHSSSNTVIKPFRFGNVFLVDQQGDYHVLSGDIKACTIEMFNLSEFDPFSVQDPFTLKIRSDMLPTITMKLRKQGESNFVEYKGTTMPVDPYESLELEYYYELRTQDDDIIRTNINKKRIEPPKSCINNFKLVEELVNMNGTFMMKLDFLTSDMIVDLQILQQGIWTNLNRRRIQKPGKIIWSLEFVRHNFDTLTRDAVIEWRLSVTCAASKFSGFSDIRRTILNKKRDIMIINGQKFCNTSFAYTDKKEYDDDDFQYYYYYKPRFTKTYWLHLFDTGYFMLIKISNIESKRSYYITGTFTLHEPKARSDAETFCHLQLYPMKYNGASIYSMEFKDSIQEHHSVFSIKELGQIILKFAQVGSTSAEFFQLSLVCKNWYKYVQKDISMTGRLKLSQQYGIQGMTFDDWLDLNFKRLYYKPPFCILDDEYK